MKKEFPLWLPRLNAVATVEYFQCHILVRSPLYSEHSAGLSFVEYLEDAIVAEIGDSIGEDFC